jgi:flagellin
MYLNTNIAAVNAQRNLYQTNFSMDRTLERLSSGLRINTAADDASGLAIVEKMYAQRMGLTTAIQNTQDSVALFKIAEGALNQVGKMLSRMEELAVRAANQTLTTSDRETIKDEIDQLLGQINTISSDTEYNSLKILDGAFDIKSSSLASSTNISSNSIKVLSVGGNAQNVTNASFIITSVGQAAMTSGAAVAAGVTSVTAAATSVAVNGVEISISVGDNVEAMLAKINAKNSQTGVVATLSSGRVVNLISGKIDADAANIVSITTGTSIGYAVIGSLNTVTNRANQIDIGGDTQIWSSYLGVIDDGAASMGIIASGINATATLDGFTMATKSSEGGTVLEMTNTGSRAYGVKIGIELFNGTYGGFIINGAGEAGSGTIASATGATNTALVRLVSSADSAQVTLNVDNKLNIQTGANYGQSLKYSIASIDTSSIGRGASSKFGSLAEIKVDTADNASLSLKVVQQAIKDVAGVRATMGSIMNRLDYTDKTLQIQRENITAAESRIRDADVSLEMTAFVKQQILTQAGTSMLAQANQKPQSIMQLLR